MVNKLSKGVGKVVADQSSAESVLVQHWRKGVWIEVRQAFTKIRIILHVKGKVEDESQHTMLLEVGKEVYGEADLESYVKNWIMPCVEVKCARDKHWLAVDKEMLGEHLLFVKKRIAKIQE